MELLDCDARGFDWNENLEIVRTSPDALCTSRNKLWTENEQNTA